MGMVCLTLCLDYIVNLYRVDVNYSGSSGYGRKYMHVYVSSFVLILLTSYLESVLKDNGESLMLMIQSMPLHN